LAGAASLVLEAKRSGKRRRIEARFAYTLVLYNIGWLLGCR
jgi:hypothetical protein